MQTLPNGLNDVKRCTKCHDFKLKSDFAKNQLWCKSCKSEHYKNNKINHLAKCKIWSENNKEKNSNIKRNCYLKNKDEYLNQAKQRYVKNSDVIKDRTRDRYRNNRELILNQEKLRWQNLPSDQKRVRILKSNTYDKNNPHLANARVALRRSRLLQATPKWLSKLDLFKIRQIYLEAKTLEKQTNIKHHVDHIYPLKGKLVCGLHVPNNLRPIPYIENVRKNNKLLEL
jgi:hypothetical protein